MDLFARPAPHVSAGGLSSVGASLTQPTPGLRSATRKKTTTTKSNAATAAASSASTSGGGNIAADVSEESKSAGGAPAGSAATGAVGSSSASALPTSALPSSTSTAQRSDRTADVDFFAPRSSSTAAAATGSGGGGSTSSSAIAAGSAVGGLKTRGPAPVVSTTPAKRGNKAMSSGGAAAASGAAAAPGGARMPGIPAKRARGFAPGATRAETIPAGGGYPMVVGDMKEDSMQQAGFEMATGMEYEGGGATYPQHATYGQQWQPPQQQPHPHPMMQPRAPAYSAPSSAYPSVEGGDLSNIEPIENASPVPVLDLSSVIHDSFKLEAAVPALRDLHLKIIQLSLSVHKAQEMSVRSRSDLFAASDSMQHIIGLLRDTWQNKFAQLQSRVTPQHAQQRYAAGPMYAPVTAVGRAAPMAPHRAQAVQHATTAAPSATAMTGGFKAGGASGGQMEQGN